MKSKKIKYHDYPIEECMRAAGLLIGKGHTVHQKWTCRHCGERQAMEDKNTFHRSGRCGKCGEVTFLTKCNYLAIMEMRL
jgi:hypothetical protein